MMKRLSLFIRQVSFSVTAMLLLVAPPLHAQEAPTADQVKAACIFNFLKFVEWPASSFSSTNAPLSIGVIANAGFAGLLTRMLEGKSISGHPLMVIPFPSATDYKQDKRCVHALYITGTANDELSRILPMDVSRPVLSIAESPGFCNKGGVIGLKVENNRLKFEINVSAAERAGLKISSKLLKLATQVISMARPSPLSGGATNV